MPLQDIRARTASSIIPGNLEIERVEWHLAGVRCIIAELKEEGLGAPSKTYYMRKIYNGEAY